MIKPLVTRTGRLLRLNLKRDGLRLLIWIIGLAGVFTVIAAKFEGIYGTQAALNTIAKTLKTPAMVSLFGAFTAKAPYTTAKIFATEMLVFMAVIMAIMNIMVAVTATRSEEDNGLLELVRAHAVGRVAPLLATAIELTALNSLIGLLFGAGLQVAQLSGADMPGNWLIGVGLAASGWLFGMLTLLLAQIATSASSTTMLSYAVLGGLYVARMGTDVRNPKLTWWVPFGWIEKLDAYQANHWLPVVALGLLGLVCLIGAILLSRQRDLGAGLITPNLGRARASNWLSGPTTLLLRQIRGSLSAWLIGSAILGAAYGSIFNTIGDLAKSNPMIEQLLGRSALAAANRVIVKQFIAVLAIVLVIVALIPAVQLMLKLVSDENKGYLHQVYATATSRWQVWASYTGVAMATAGLVLLTGCLGMYGMGAMVMTKPIQWSSYSQVWLAYLPAMAVMIATASLLVGWAPKWRHLAWIWTFYGFLSLYLGRLIELPKWARQLTPLGFVNQVPVHALNWSTSGWLLGLTLLILGLASWGYRRRDQID